MVHVKTDHQPLEGNFKKDLGSALKRLQRILSRLQRYNLDGKYQKGSLMVVSDHQSRASRTDRAQLKEFKERTASNDKLQILISTVLEGWPSTLDKVPAEFKPYFQFEDEMIAQTSLLFKGERLIAPAKLGKEIMGKVHSSNLGTEGCLDEPEKCFTGCA